MSHRKIEVEVYRCDFTNDEGELCETEGERQQVRQCAVCNKDLCNRHYELWSVNSQPGRVSLTYIFCPEHAKAFIEMLMKAFGDTRPVAYYGMGK